MKSATRCFYHGEMAIVVYFCQDKSSIKIDFFRLYYDKKKQSKPLIVSKKMFNFVVLLARVSKTF